MLARAPDEITGERGDATAVRVHALSDHALSDHALCAPA